MNSLLAPASGTIPAGRSPPRAGGGRRNRQDKSGSARGTTWTAISLSAEKPPGTAATHVIDDAEPCRRAFPSDLQRGRRLFVLACRPGASSPRASRLPLLSPYRLTSRTPPPRAPEPSILREGEPGRGRLLERGAVGSTATTAEPRDLSGAPTSYTSRTSSAGTARACASTSPITALRPPPRRRSFLNASLHLGRTRAVLDWTVPGEPPGSSRCTTARARRVGLELPADRTGDCVSSPGRMSRSGRAPPHALSPVSGSSPPTGALRVKCAVLVSAPPSASEASRRRSAQFDIDRLHVARGEG